MSALTNRGSPRGKVLLAEDDNDNRMLLTFLLESEGWQVIEACNGKVALDKVITEQPQVVILDIRMPEFTGTQVYQKLREQDISIPIVFVTAFSDLEELASSLGIRYFLSKPFDLPELLGILESAYQDSVKTLTSSRSTLQGLA